MSLKFRLFLWKNLKYVKSHWISTSFLTVACCALIVIYEAVTHYSIQSENWIYETKPELDLLQEFNLQNGDVICYSPDTSEIEEFMSRIRESFEIPYNGIIPYKTAGEMYEFLNGKTQTRSFGIAFHNFPDGTPTNPSYLLNYTISTTHGAMSTNEVYLNDKRPVRRRDYDDYTSSGFFILQRVIDKNFIKMSGREFPFELEVSPFPKKAIEEYDCAKVTYFGIIFLLMTYVNLLVTMLIPLVEEKDDGIKEFISLGTRYRFVNEVTFVIVRLFLYIPIVVVATFAGYFWESLNPINIGVVIIFLGLYVISLMCYTLLISVCFQSVFFAKVAGTLLYLIHLFFDNIGDRLYIDFTYISNGKAFLEGIKTFTSFINKDRQFSLEDLNTTVLPGTWSIANIFVWLSSQCVLYVLLYIYFSIVFPGRGGIPQKFYFPFQRSYWRKNKNFNPNNWNSSNHAVQVRKLSKVYKRGFNRTKVAVDGIDMNIKKNNITVLLGHNGAGKTTTLNMIVGLTPKTSGEIQVSEASEISEYRHLIGYCPQHSIFMKYLTCEEHLKFFGQLKGLDAISAAKESEIILKKLRLEDKAQEQGKNLSGGMKRKLSLGIAISGRTKIVILDEPSSGLDPESRRELWNILLNIRKTQAVLVTTHFMEEAEVLGDTVAIMSHGKLVCCDSIPNLKKQYGSGYVLKLLLDGQNDPRILNFVQEFIETACVKSFVSPTLSISLPYDTKEKYSDLLKALEVSMMDLKIKTISMTNTTLEDVFLNCEKTTEDMIDSSAKETTNLSYQTLDMDTNERNIRSDNFHFFWAVLYKKIKYLQREWMYVTFMFLIPVVAVVLSYQAMSSANSADVMQSRLTFSVNHLFENRIYLKISSEFNHLRNYLTKEIGRANATSVPITEDISVNDYLLKLHAENLNDYYNNILGAVEVVPNGGQHLIRIYYSGNAIHSSSIMLNLVDDALAKLAMGENAKIQTSNMPVQKSLVVSRGRLEYFAHIVPLGFFLYILFYVSLPFKEEKSEFKKLQNVPTVIYWFTYYAFDLMLHFFFCWIVLGLQCAIDTHHIYTTDEKTSITMFLIFYGVGYLPLMYILSSTFRTMSGISTFLFTLVLVSSILPLITSSNAQSMTEYEGLISFFSLIPDFSLKHQLHILNENYFISRRNDQIKSGKDHSFASFSQTYKIEPTISHMPAYFITLLFMLIVEVLFVFYLDNPVRREKLSEVVSLNRPKKGAADDTSGCPENEDVHKEKQSVKDIVTGSKVGYYSLVVDDLQKTYGKMRAVRGINFAVKQGECFGLLGLNGAGKTSTFQMITGNSRITAGEIYINGQRCSSNLHIYKDQFGYCPQADALNQFMTGRETLTYFGLLRGMSFSEASYEAVYWLTQLHLRKYENVPVREYSGGTKRKLNTAIAMIGQPSVIFLDEPTTGVDPKSRRFIWECIQKKQKLNNTIILTSHSMDECEFLCNRLAIMARGELRCIGFIPHLKDTIGKGCTFTFKIKENLTKGNRRLSRFEEEVDKRFQNALKSEEHGEFVTYSLQQQKVIWSNVFETLHSIFIEFQDIIDDYNVSETTLEDVFLKCE